MGNLDLYLKLKQVPAEAKKTIVGGRLKGFTDINPMFRIKQLTTVFGACGFGWKYKILEQKIEQGANGEIAAFVTIDLFVKQNDIWSEPIPGLGGSMFVVNEKNGKYTSDECFKMALTDAIGNAGKNLGLCADVYYEKDRTKYDIHGESNGQQQKQPTQPPAQAQTPPTQQKTIDEALGEINNCKTIEELTKCWTNNKIFQTNKLFIAAKDLKKGLFNKENK